jgi:uncharacterized SAM-binding protein YcdF (DUF218 family)
MKPINHAETTQSFKQPQRMSLTRKLLCLAGGAGGFVALFLTSTIAIRLTIATHYAPEPEGILVLGGGTGREEFAAQFASKHPRLNIWVSSGRHPEALNIFKAAGFPEEQLNFGWYAEDTVGDFAHHVDALQDQNIRHVYLITSDYHMPRARTIATIVFGSQGIAVTPVPIPSEETESWSGLRIARDTFRSVLWVFTGRVGTSVTQWIKG